MAITMKSTTLRRLAVGLAVVAALGAGCKHRRSAYRPVYVDPEPVLIEPSPSSGTVIPTDPVAPYDDPYGSSSAVPGFEDTYGSYGSSSYAPPVAPPAESEPALNLDPIDESLPAPVDTETVPSDVTSPPAVDVNPPQVGGPQTRLDRGGRVGGSAPMTRRTALRTQVQQMADDPIDLVQPPKADRPWRYVVLHHSARPAGGYAQIDRDHRELGGMDGCGYHFVIGNGTGSRDGVIEVTRRWSEQRPGAHCRDAAHPAVNDDGIGICLVGDLDAGPPTPKQVETARALVAYLQQRYAIPPERVVSHANVSATPTACPGSRFPTEVILGHRAQRNLAAR